MKGKNNPELVKPYIIKKEYKIKQIDLTIEMYEDLNSHSYQGNKRAFLTHSLSI